MDAYKSLLAELETELEEIRNIDVSARVEDRLTFIRAQLVQEELDAKRDAEEKKVAEINALNRIIARLPAEEPVAEETAESAEEAVAEENVVEG